MKDITPFNMTLALAYSHTENDLSPNTMAHKALTAGIAVRKRRQIISGEDYTTSESQIFVDTTVNIHFENEENCAENNNCTKHGVAYKEEPDKYLESIWNEVITSSNQLTPPQDDHVPEESNHEKILRKILEANDDTKKIIQIELEKFFREGLEAFHKCDSLLRELNQTKELCDARGKELLRLQTSEAESKHLVSVRY